MQREMQTDTGECKTKTVYRVGIFILQKPALPAAQQDHRVARVTTEGLMLHVLWDADLLFISYLQVLFHT